jgi:signal transduction histidine kinase
MNIEHPKTDRVRWIRSYRTALGRSLTSTGPVAERSARTLGRRAVALGMETLDVAGIHSQSLLAARADGARVPGGVRATAARARRFLMAVLDPVEQGHRPALKAKAQTKKLAHSVRQRTREASLATRKLKQGIARRQSAETALKKSEQRHAELLVEAVHLERQLQDLARKMLAAQEQERTKSGRRLQDEIAQALIAIQVRLLALKGIDRVNAESLKNEIAEMQRMVKQSVRMIDRLARAFEGDA